MVRLTARIILSAYQTIYYVMLMFTYFPGGDLYCIFIDVQSTSFHTALVRGLGELFGLFKTSRANDVTNLLTPFSLLGPVARSPFNVNGE